VIDLSIFVAIFDGASSTGFSVFIIAESSLLIDSTSIFSFFTFSFSITCTFSSFAITSFIS